MALAKIKQIDMYICDKKHAAKCDCEMRAYHNTCMYHFHT